MKKSFAIALAALVLSACHYSPIPLYKNPDAPIEDRIDDLLDRMTIDEMIAQTNLVPHWMSIDSTVRAAIARDEVGAILKASSTELTRSLQEDALKSSRLGIPLMFHEDVIHGFRTIFPIPLAEACSWDREQVLRNSAAIAREAAAAGLQLTYAPMVDISNDGRWGRIMETSGEDPYLSGELSAARVHGFQGEDLSDPYTIMACVKHFAGYAAVSGGRDYTNTEFSQRDLEEVYLPPYRACIEAGVGAVMESYLTYDGIPVTFSKYLLKDVLRDELKFEGLLMTDWKTMWYAQQEGAVSDPATSALRAIRAGIDMDMTSETYLKELKELLVSGKISKHQIREAARNCLRVKFQMGLFEDPFRYCDPEREAAEVLSDAIRKEARTAAAGSMVLLKNEGVLPLAEGSCAGLYGPLADDGENYLGAWACKGRPEEVVTVEDAFSSAFVRSSASPVAVVCIGEPRKIIGEGVSTGKLELDPAQVQLVKNLKKQGKKVVTVLFNGRPLALGEIVDNSDAILEAWYPGTEGGNAVVDILCGRYNPSGRLCQTFPRHVGQVPMRYNQYRSFFDLWVYDIPVGPQYEFGYGLSYTEFSYSDPVVAGGPEFKSGEMVTVSVDVTNTGKVRGTETVQVYVADLVSSVVPRVKQLKEFAKVDLEPGETRTVSFTLPGSAFEAYTEDHRWEIEPGEFRIEVGHSCTDTKSVVVSMK